MDQIDTSISRRSSKNRKDKSKRNRKRSRSADGSSGEQHNNSDLDTAESSDNNSMCEDFPEQNAFKLIDYYYFSFLLCFAGVVICYSGYAVLQESL